MTSTTAVLTTLALLLAAGCTTGEPNGPQSVGAQSNAATDGGAKMVCTREHVVGSNRAQTICLTAKQRTDITQRSSTATEKIREGGYAEEGTRTAP